MRRAARAAAVRCTARRTLASRTAWRRVSERFTRIETLLDERLPLLRWSSDGRAHTLVIFTLSSTERLFQFGSIVSSPTQSFRLRGRPLPAGSNTVAWIFQGSPRGPQSSDGLQSFEAAITQIDNGVLRTRSFPLPSEVVVHTIHSGLLGRACAR